MIEIIYYEPVPKDPLKPNSKVIAYLDVKVPAKNGKMIIRNIAHLQDGEKRWFNLSGLKRPKGDGTFFYPKYWEYEFGSHNKMLLDMLPESVKIYLEGNPRETNLTDFGDIPF